MDHGGAWVGFQFAGFALTPSAYPANWDWYPFLGSGSYVSNTWRLTSAVLGVELAHAKYVKAISYAKVKTDRVDARMLAQLLVPRANIIGR